MARVVVIGGGYGGLASAARLSKLGHQVTLIEAGQQLGGALSTVSAEGFTWESGPTTTLVPAVVRDLFRKSGRPLETELGGDLVPLEVVREHRFEDTSVLRLPAGSRAAQTAAFEELRPKLGAAWEAHVDSYEEVWEVLRRHYFEEPWTPDALPAEVRRLFDSRETMHKRLRRAFRDDRPASVAAYPFESAGHDLRNVPSWAGLETYLEQCFGVWTVPGGMHRLRDLLAERLKLREVDVLLDSSALDVVVREGRVAAVSTLLGEVAADAVVCAVDPRRLPSVAHLVERTMPALPPVITHLGLEGEVPDIPHETVIHGNPMITIRPGGTAPDGGTCWTLTGRGRLAEDMVMTLARAKIRVRDQVVARIDRSPLELVQTWGGSPFGTLWQGRGTVRDRVGPTTPIGGLYTAGSHATPGAGLAFVGLSAALVATSIGEA